MIFFMTKDRKVNYVSKTNIDSVIYLGGGGLSFAFIFGIYNHYNIDLLQTLLKIRIKIFFFTGHVMVPILDIRLATVQKKSSLSLPYT